MSWERMGGQDRVGEGAGTGEETPASPTSPLSVACEVSRCLQGTGVAGHMVDALIKHHHCLTAAAATELEVMDRSSDHCNTTDAEQPVSPHFTERGSYLAL